MFTAIVADVGVRHDSTDSLCVCLSLFICLCLPLNVCLLSLSVFVYLSVPLSNCFSLSLSPSPPLSLRVSLSLSPSLSVCVNISLFVSHCLSLCLCFVCLSPLSFFLPLSYFLLRFSSVCTLRSLRQEWLKSFF